MPAIMTEAPTLFVVGAGHLPGDNGVLNLLKQQGYTIEAHEINPLTILSNNFLMASYTKRDGQYHHALFAYTLYSPHHTVHPKKLYYFLHQSLGSYSDNGHF